MRMWLYSILFVFVIVTNAAAQTFQPLFFIERTLNANVVHYDAQIDGNGTLNREEPVVAYWLMNAEDGRRESLTFIERTTAYGFSVKPDMNPGDYLLTIVSFNDRPIRVFMNNGRARALMTINGYPAFLEKVFIRASGPYSRPYFIEFHGTDTVTGEARVEKVCTE